MQTLTEALKTVRWGLILSLLAICFGFALGGAFGAAEESFKGYLQSEGEMALASIYAHDSEKMQAVVSKSWTYFKRAHMHGSGIGTSTLAVSLLLAGLTGAASLRALVAAGLGLGALGYSVFWLLAGMRAPGLGGTGAAKESLSWLAVPSTGLLLLGLLTTLCLTGWSLWRKN